MVDVNTPVTNPRLKTLLHQLSVEQTVNVQNLALEEIALHAHFLSVVIISDLPKGDDSGILTLKENTTIQLPILTAVDERNFYPVFTDWEELRRWNQEENPQTLILTFDDYADMVATTESAAGIVVNPFGESLTLNRELLAHMKTHKDILSKGVSKQEVNQETEVLLGEPKEYPTAMVEEICQYLKKNKAVRTAWLRLMIKNQEQSFLLVVDFQGEKEAVLGAIAAVAKPYLKEMYLDMVPLETEFGQSAVQNIEPFYQRKKGLFGL